MSTNANSDNVETESTGADTDARGEQEPGVDQDGVDIATEGEQEESAVTESPETEFGIESKEAGQDVAGTVDDANAKEESTVEGPPAKFQAAIQGGKLKTVLKTLRAIVDEARIHIDKNGISMRAVDPANVAMDDLDLNAAAFESYDATPGIVGVDLGRFADVVGMANKDDLVQLSFDQQTRKLVIHVDDVEFTMACLNPKTIRAEPEIPDLDHPAEVTISRDALDRGVKAADMVSDHIRFTMDDVPELFSIEAEGDTDDVSLEIDSEDLEDVTAADAEGLFSLDYLKDIVRTIPKGTAVRMTFGTDLPVIMAYELADGDGQVNRMLAPRIRTD
ncbi:DNA polymerase sliding clamp [Halorussus litoreus]|uniref:DNA polymerase sliding clamp n=1 Tax=Halorussus litoreus TaxID=1710536 RepID=UPI000E256C6A|nr:DNA polymerase sliding clamp [Halorussus litoreus]